MITLNKPKDIPAENFPGAARRKAHSSGCINSTGPTLIADIKLTIQQVEQEADYEFFIG